VPHEKKQEVEETHKMENIQEILFENKEKIPEGIYLELMNSLKKAHKNHPKLYKCKYIVLTPRVSWSSSEMEFNIIPYHPHRSKFECIVDISTLHECNQVKIQNFIEPFEISSDERDIKSFPCVDCIDQYIRHFHSIKPDNSKSFADDDDASDEDECDKTIHITSRFECKTMVLVYSCVPV